MCNLIHSYTLCRNLCVLTEYDLVFNYVSSGVPSTLIYVKTGDKNVPLVFQHCWKTSSKAMMCVSPPTLKPSLQQIRFCKLCEY